MPRASKEIFSVGLALVFCVAAFAREPAEMDTAALYARACAACHGADGGGLAPDSALAASFDRQPASFLDPLFNSREPAGDWRLVVQHGGKRLGLSDKMPAYDEALSEAQIDALVGYLKSLPPEAERYPPGDLNLTRPIATTKAFPEDEALIINRWEPRDDGADTLLTTLYYARRFGPRGHAEVKLTHESKGSESFLEELEVEYKHVVSYSLERRILHSLGAEIAVPLEDDDAPEVLIPYYAVAKVLAPRATFQGQLRAKLPTDDLGDGVAELRGVVHWLPSEWPRSVTPGVELTLAEPFSGGSGVATLIPQLYAGLSKGGHVAFAVGVEIPLTDEAYDYRVRSFLLWDIADGPFWQGW